MKLYTSQTLAVITEDLLRKGTHNKVLHFTLSLNHDAYIPEDHRPENSEVDEICHYYYLHFVIYRPGNYTIVLWAVTEHPGVQSGQIFTQSSYHDSGWRRDGIERTLEIVNKKSKETLCKEYVDHTGKKPSNENISCSISLGFGGVGGIQLLDAEVTREGIFDEEDYPQFTVEVSPDTKTWILAQIH